MSRARPQAPVEGTGSRVDAESAPDRLRRAALIAAVAGVGALGGGRRAHAQGSARGLRILVAAPPGGTPDVVARHYAARLGDLFPGGVLVENRPGAAGLIAVGALQQAGPDGVTTLLGHAGLATMYPFLYTRLPYEPAADLVAVAPAAETAFALAVGPAVPAAVKTLGDYVRWARAEAGGVSYGTPGNGTLPHIMGALLARAAAFQAHHVAYAGGPPSITDLIGGRLASVVLPVGLLRPLHLAGKVRVLASSGAARGSVLPDVPTLVEEGYPTLVLREWWGFFVARGTPEAAVQALAQPLRAAATAPELAAALEVSGLQAIAGSPAQMQERLVRERSFWRDALPPAAIRMD